MKIAVSFLLIVFLSTKLFASEVIDLGVSTSLESSVLNETRPYMVYLPPSYHASKTSFPVIYLLDGDVHRFKGFVGVLESLSTATLENQVQQAIVVAVPNTNRTRDLTPSVLKEWTFKGKVLDRFEKTGNASQFSLFLKDELIPHIELSYRASEIRVLVGESFGGLFSAFTFLQAQSPFTDYLIIDPTALWDNDYLNRTYESGNKDININTDVFFAFANNSHLGEIGLINYKWGSEFASKVINKATKQVNASQQYFENERHGTVAFLAWYKGLKVLLPAKHD